MATDVTMPRLSDSMEEGTILKWLVSEGDEVKKGQEIVEIETDKANMTYESDTAGTVIELVASEGDTLDLGEVIARIGDADEASSGSDDGGSDSDEEADDSSQEAEAEGQSEDEDSEGDEGSDGSDDSEEPAAEGDDDSEGEAEEERQEQPASSSNGASADDDGRVKASPVAKRMAEELGVELGDIDGSGPGGRIVKSDVEAAAEGGGTKTKEKDEDEAPKSKDEGSDDGDKSKDGGEPEREPEPEPAGDAGPKGELKTIDLTRLQKTVSRRMAESKATAPDFQLNATIDMSACVELRARLKEVAETAPSYNDMVVKACANALREYPRVNGAYRDGRFELYSRVNVGVAVAAQDTLVVPTIFDADKKSLGEISRTAREAIAKVRDGKITPPELSGGTFTVSNLGMYGIDTFSAVINPPQAAILAVGSLKKRAVVDEESGRIVARDTMGVTMVCDHRILYGADGAEFLARVRELLESPLALAL
jgi:pyruvate dehydrogenase E2 component (dihydrolipoamide acetyltransferase)